jgi:acetylornithine deacetylase/succinyl-diaminopimelate desuccinylase-like protein
MTGHGIDWDAVGREALDLFVRYLQIDTTNPPGNEAPAARFLGSVLEAEGIACEYIETAPNREAVVARLPGDGSFRPLMLCNHTDVVPVEEEYWDVPPFAGLVNEGRVYGRGAVDMKGCGIMHLMTMLMLRRQGVRLRRDVVFLAVPDEEAGSEYGMAWLCEHRPDVVDVEYELSEGGGGSNDFLGQDTRMFTVATNEKQLCWLRLTAIGTPGHGSRPHDDNSAVRLARAVVRLSEWQRPVTLTDEARAYFERLAARGLMPAPGSREFDETLHETPHLMAAVTNTLNVTVLDSGTKVNVIPARSEALVDCRLLPGQSKAEWIDEVRAVIDDERIEVTKYLPDQGENVAVEWDTELYRIIEDVVTDAVEDAFVVPGTTIGGTDNRFLRARGIPAYGFIPCLLSAGERAGFHGHNEYLAVDNLNMGCELTYEIVHRMCT